MYQTTALSRPLLIFQEDTKEWHQESGDKKVVWVEVDKNISPILEIYIAAFAMSNPTTHCYTSFQSHLIDPSKSSKSPICVKATSPIISGNVMLTAGIGIFVVWSPKTKEMIHCLHQLVGKPVGTECGVDQMTKWFVYGTNGVAVLLQFLADIVAEHDKLVQGRFIPYSWLSKQRTWIADAECNARSIETVYLPPRTKKVLIDDVVEFLRPETKVFYAHHHIPYRRSYLFHGPPGSGKTSMVQALMTLGRKYLYIPMLTSEEMTDESLHYAMQKVREDSVVLLEDIDAIFDIERHNRVCNSKLTFTGLLNAIDGVDNPKGYILILTTNNPHHLDPSLIRPGRVDVHVAFHNASNEQIEEMWTSFYPQEKESATVFSKRLRVMLGEKQISMCMLQHYFVKHRAMQSSQAIIDIPTILRDMEEREYTQHQ
jgi:mitochondrial chaperone BCS1